MLVQLRKKIGTAASAESAAPLAGRYSIVHGDERDYLYLPELQELFAIPQQMADALSSIQAAGTDTEESVAARAELEKVVLKRNGRPLATHRSGHQGLRDLVIHVAQRCNLDCVYCYAHDLNARNDVMSDATADAVVRKATELATDGLSSVKFLGGEPTIAWRTVERLVTAFESESLRQCKPVPTFVMVTNGTLMTERIVRFAAEHAMHVLVSVDGQQAIHDALRPAKGGQGSHTRAVSAVAALREANCHVAIESVYTRKHLESGITVQDLVDEFLQLGIREFQIAPTVGVWHEVDTVDETDAVTNMFADAARACVRSYRTDQPHLLRGIQFVLDGFALREKRSHVCGAGRTFMAVNYDGEAFPCYLLQSPSTSYGFVEDSALHARYSAVNRRFEANGKDHHPVCRTCWANEICQSCLGTSFQIEATVTKPPAWFCRFQKAIIAAVLGEIAAARASQQWDQFMVNMERHLRPLRPSE